MKYKKILKVSLEILAIAIFVIVLLILAIKSPVIPYRMESQRFRIFMNN